MLIIMGLASVQIQKVLPFNSFLKIKPSMYCRVNMQPFE
jgi:hypothetical protein